ncbi:F-box/kelch-repeat protein At3g06240 [Jatropha curcas]|uniref:F-box/kelch-repeat protein At3g06240 n=1 Tax=Jatropha curcas TaxID=180498 RepID=UPI0009D6A6D5|nr:F-box/kelch-repeat protein At3g06240 [Jatropha curcas]
MAIAMANNKNQRNQSDEGDGEEGEITLPTLPQEIHREILLRLPVKSLCKFSGLVPVKEHDYAFKNIPNDWFEDEDGNVDTESVDTLCTRNWVEIWGSCDGLVCILICISPYEDALFLLNPSTGESKRILDKDTNWPSMFGFGYDSINDDYKVLQIDFGAVVTLYSLKNDSWREMGMFPYYGDIYDSWMFLHGSFHWVVINRKDQKPKYVISAFDIAKETFWEMAAPDIDISCGLVTGILNGCLCVIYSWKGMHDDFWVMREYGVTNSWTRLTISLSYIHMKPLGLAKNGEAVLQVDGRLVQCNLEKNSCKEIVVHGIPVGDKVCAETYIESLISVNGYCGSGNEIQMQS